MSAGAQAGSLVDDGKLADHAGHALTDARRHDAFCKVDRGLTLVEILVSIVLLGLAAGGTLGAMAMAVRGSAVHRDLTNAQEWLQSASDNLQGQPRQDCDNVGGVAGEAESRIRSTYQNYVQTIGSPDGWVPSQITVLYPVLFWDGDQYQTTCYDNYGINLQLVKLQVKDPSGRVVRTLQVVKGA